jgi:hypothetical protein
MLYDMSGRYFIGEDLMTVKLTVRWDDPRIEEMTRGMKEDDSTPSRTMYGPPSSATVF